MKPDVNTYLMLAEKALKPSLMDKRLIDYFKADPLIQAAFRIEEIELTHEYIVMEDELGVIAAYLKAKDAYELSNFEALQEGLEEYGIYVEDGHSFDNELTAKELKEVEASERAQDNEKYLLLHEQYQDFKKVITAATTWDEVSELLNEHTKLAAIEQLQKSIDNRNPIEKTAWLGKRGNEERTLTEAAQVATKVSQTKRTEVKLHNDAVVNGVLERIGDYFEIGVVYTRKICTEKVNALIKSNKSKYTIENIRDALKTFSRFNMYTEDGELKTKYSTAVRYYELTHFGLITEEMLEPLKRKRATPKIN
jgi:hypothetical protein